jgi:hypothetical protein
MPCRLAESWLVLLRGMQYNAARMMAQANMAKVKEQQHERDD